ncbi:hypothetical protein CHCC20490_1807 [Bacillus paralicheniformis]|nr:hypothetical protein CHCC20490_1807 [Bacillus paralicheniformis]
MLHLLMLRKEHVTLKTGFFFDSIKPIYLEQNGNTIHAILDYLK